ncbi:MAG: hypothetical protein JWR15_2428, partial [Prosthecobacter sp.]|nr:hypothetical protein [Prosthecobacter sp.]
DLFLAAFACSGIFDACVATLQQFGQSLASSWKDHLAELEAIFPEPVIGAAEELELSREDRF